MWRRAGFSLPPISTGDTGENLVEGLLEGGIGNCVESLSIVLGVTLPDARSDRLPSAVFGRVISTNSGSGGTSGSLELAWVGMVERVLRGTGGGTSRVSASSTAPACA